MTHRRTWQDFPPPLRQRLETLLGEPVVATRCCRGGFSPSSAPVPALVDVFDESEWFVLVTEVALGALPEPPCRAAGPGAGCPR